MATSLSNKRLEISIPVKLLRSPLLFDTPPATPLDNVAILQTPSSSFVSFTPRTPRKLLHPVRTFPSTKEDRGALLSFRMCKLSNDSSMSLKISCSFNNWRHGRPYKARRMLFCEDTVIKNTQPRHRKPTRAKKPNHTIVSPPYSTEPSYSDFIDDADDEMDQIDLLSPPSTPLPKLSTEEIPLPSKIVRYTKTTSSTNKKTCYSCHTTKTPLWRDSEDGIPYCNACGIRYRKYRIRCSKCYYIPHKDELVTCICSICGMQLRSTSKHRVTSR